MVIFVCFSLKISYLSFSKYRWIDRDIRLPVVDSFRIFSLKIKSVVQMVKYLPCQMSCTTLPTINSFFLFFFLSELEWHTFCKTGSIITNQVPQCKLINDIKMCIAVLGSIILTLVIIILMISSFVYAFLLENKIF